MYLQHTIVSDCCAGIEMCAYVLLCMHNSDLNIRLVLLPGTNDTLSIIYSVVVTPLTIKS